MRGHREPPPPPDPALDQFRAGVAIAYDGDILVGHLLTRVDAWWTTVGPVWRRRQVDPVEKVDWLLYFDAAYTGRHEDGWSQGVPLAKEELGELRASAFSYRGRSLRLVWLTGDEAEKIRSEYEG